MSDVAFALSPLAAAVGTPGAAGGASANAMDGAQGFASALAAQSGAPQRPASPDAKTSAPPQGANGAATATPRRIAGAAVTPTQTEASKQADEAAPSTAGPKEVLAATPARVAVEAPVEAGAVDGVAPITPDEKAGAEVGAPTPPVPATPYIHSSQTGPLASGETGAPSPVQTEAPQPPTVQAPVAQPPVVGNPLAQVAEAGAAQGRMPAPAAQALVETPPVRDASTAAPVPSPATVNLPEQPKPSQAGARDRVDAALQADVSSRSLPLTSAPVASDGKRSTGASGRDSDKSASRGSGETTSPAPGGATTAGGPTNPAVVAPGPAADPAGAAPLDLAPSTDTASADVAPLDPAAEETGVATGAPDQPESAPADARMAGLRMTDPGLHGRLNAIAQISAQILRRIEGNATRFEVALTPEDLGRVDVTLEIDGDGSLVARLAFDNPAAAAELRGQADQLRRELEAAGLQLARDALEFTDRRQGDGSQGFDRRGSRAFAGAVEVVSEADAPVGAYRLSMTPRGVDLRV